MFYICRSVSMRPGRFETHFYTGAGWTNDKRYAFTFANRADAELQSITRTERCYVSEIVASL